CACSAMFHLNTGAALLPPHYLGGKSILDGGACAGRYHRHQRLISFKWSSVTPTSVRSLHFRIRPQRSARGREEKPRWIQNSLPSRCGGASSPALGILSAKRGTRLWFIRSEEHTSELQSRFDLV